MREDTERHPAILLVGPTGAGKSPLGEYLERNGLEGRRCRHFDFGANLRAVDGGHVRVPALSPEDLAMIRRMLEFGALLEDKDFHVVAAIFKAFVKHHRMSSRDWVIMNGMPRHVSQARDVDWLVDVRLVTSLECERDTVCRRIAMNSGGDRGGRTDDGPDAVRRKLEIFGQRTAPILDHYRAKGVSVRTFTVGVETTPALIAGQLATGAEMRVGRGVK